MLVLCLLISAAALIVYFCVFNGPLSDTANDYGLFGDYIGGVIGAIAALASAYLVFITYRHQQDTSYEQARLSRKSQFESDFFQLLNTQRDIVRNLSVVQRDPMDSKKEIRYSGLSAISKAAEDIKTSMLQLEEDTARLRQMSFETIREEVNSLFSEAMSHYGDVSFGHYFRHLYHLMKYVDESEQEDKGLYMTFIQAQMSNDELFFLFFNALSDYGYPKSYRIIERYAFLRNLSYSDFEYFKVLQHKCYPKTFFKYAPNNAILIVGYFTKLRENTIVQLAQDFQLQLIDVEHFSPSLFGRNRVLRICNQNGKVVKERVLIDNILQLLSAEKVTLLDGSLYCRGRNLENALKSAENNFLELSPKAIILCSDSVEEISATFNEGQRQVYGDMDISQILSFERTCVERICNKYRIPMLMCRSNDSEAMARFISNRV